MKKRNLNGTKGISSVTVSKPNFLPIKENNLKQIVTIKIVIKYANHEVGVRRFFKFHNLVFSRGYLEKKKYGRYATAEEQRATLLLLCVHAKVANVAKSASSISI